MVTRQEYKVCAGKWTGGDPMRAPRRSCDCGRTFVLHLYVVVMLTGYDLLMCPCSCNVPPRQERSTRWPPRPHSASSNIWRHAGELPRFIRRRPELAAALAESQKRWPRTLTRASWTTTSGCHTLIGESRGNIRLSSLPCAKPHPVLSHCWRITTALFATRRGPSLLSS